MARKKKVTTTTTTVTEEIIDDVNSSVLDMVIAFDTTGSMRSYIQDVQNHVKELIPELLNTNDDLRLSIVAFGDYCDMNSATDFGNAYQSIGLTNDANALINFVESAKYTGGGDADEFYELVIRKIIDETEWRQNSKKSVLLIADANPHPLGYSYGNRVVGNQIDWRAEAERGVQFGIQFDTLSLHNYGENWYEELSRMSNGVYSEFKTSSKTTDFVKIATYARGGEKTRSAYMTCYNSCLASGDKELKVVADVYAIKNAISTDSLTSSSDNISLDVES